MEELFPAGQDPRPAGDPRPSPGRQPASGAGPYPGPPRRTPPQPEPSEPGLLACMEATLYAVLKPADVFGKFGRLPPPGFPEMILNILFWAGFGQILAVLIVLNRLSTGPGLGLPAILLFVTGGVIAAVPISFAAAGLLHALAMVSGGQGGFSRTYQIVSLLGAMAPLTALLLWVSVPLLWIAPTLYVTYLAVTAVEKMHAAPGTQAFMVVGLLGGLAAAAQVVFHKDVARFQYRLENTATIYSTNPESADEVAGQTAASLEPPGGAVAPYGAAGTGYREPGRLDAGDDPGYPTQAGHDPAPRSSLDLLRSGDHAERDRSVSYSQPARQGVSPQRVQQMQDTTLNIVQMVQRELHKNPKALSGLPPEQAAKVRRYLRQAERYASGDETGETAAGPVVSDQEAEQMMRQLQGMFKGMSAESDPDARPRSGSRSGRRQRRKTAPSAPD
ncbi:MAG: Yip1 family protein [Elusimicrobiota bacterium]